MKTFKLYGEKSYSQPARFSPIFDSNITLDDILCAEISMYNGSVFHLKRGFSLEDVWDFEKKVEASLNEYNNRLKTWLSVIWLKDGSWMSFDDCDTSGEYWVHHKMPDIPNYL